MSLLSDARILYHLVFHRAGGEDHQQRLENFYSGQASGYDDFRRRLLKGREALYRSIPVPDGGVWLDMGGGTGANLEAVADRIPRLSKVYVVDLSTSLLEVARARIAREGWTNVEAVEADVTTFRPPEQRIDVVTFSYSLTMIPDWFAAVDHAADLLAPGGHIGVVDFFVSRKYPGEGLRRHGWFTRHLWPTWFASDNVFLSPDHVPYLQRRFETARLAQRRGAVPYMMGLTVPYYQFLGRKR